MNTHTPYDAEIADGEGVAHVRGKLKREGYLRAQADMKPRHEALVAACHAALKAFRDDFDCPAAWPSAHIAAIRCQDSLRLAEEEA